MQGVSEVPVVASKMLPGTRTDNYARRRCRDPRWKKCLGIGRQFRKKKKKKKKKKRKLDVLLKSTMAIASFHVRLLA